MLPPTRRKKNSNDIRAVYAEWELLCPLQLAEHRGRACGSPSAPGQVYTSSGQSSTGKGQISDWAVLGCPLQQARQRHRNAIAKSPALGTKAVPDPKDRLGDFVVMNKQICENLGGLG
ncbi:hypothetical protein CB1_001402096 [Camelus ferus]|nr:hypothetical protein CB1_001402096 [Camelus ferus]